jgi:hypothetical protein
MTASTILKLVNDGTVTAVSLRQPQLLSQSRLLLLLLLMPLIDFVH